MSVRPNLQCVQGIFESFGALDPQGVVARMTEDVVLRPSAFVTGRTEFRGKADLLEGLMEFKEQLARSGQRVRITPIQYFADRADDDVLLVLAKVEIIREDGGKFGTDMAYRFTLEDDKVRELEAWLDHEEGLSMLADPVELEV